MVISISKDKPEDIDAADPSQFQVNDVCTIAPILSLPWYDTVTLNRYLKKNMKTLKATAAGRLGQRAEFSVPEPLLSLLPLFFLYPIAWTQGSSQHKVDINTHKESSWRSHLALAQEAGKGIPKLGGKGDSLYSENYLSCAPMTR